MKRFFLLFSALIALTITFSAVAKAANFANTNMEDIHELNETNQQSEATPLTSPSWLDTQELEGIAYFLFESPARIERYDLNNETWLADITLNEQPTAFTVDQDGLYIGFVKRTSTGFAKHTSRYDLNGGNEQILHNFDSLGTVQNLFTHNDFLYIIYYFNTVDTVNKYTGAVISTKNIAGDSGFKGIDISPSKARAFSFNTRLSPTRMQRFSLNPDGSIGNIYKNYNYGSYSGEAKQTFVAPNETVVIGTDGMVYNTDTLEINGTFAGSFDDLVFHADQPIVLRNGTLILHSNNYLEIGQYSPAVQPHKITIRNEDIISFTDTSNGIAINKIPISLLSAPEPAVSINPNGLAYTPDSIIFDNSNVVYLLSKEHKNIFRWSISQREYLDSIPLIGEPEYITYSKNPERLYLVYPSGKITYISLDTTPLNEIAFANLYITPSCFGMAGEFLFACDYFDSSTHYTFNSSGNIVSIKSGHPLGAVHSDTFVWSENNNKLYYLRMSSPRDIMWKEVNEFGQIGSDAESPYHNSTGFDQPVRVKPDGSYVILGSGRIFDPISLTHTATLPNNLSDASWLDGNLLTLRAFQDDSELQNWGTDYQVDFSKELVGAPIRIFPTNEGVLAITNYLNKPWFSIWDSSFNEIYQAPIYKMYAPAVLNDYCSTPYVDDFSNTNSGWPIGDTGITRYGYLNDEYNIYHRDSGRWFAITRGDNSLDATGYSVEGRIIQNNGIWGLIFGLNDDWSNFYTFEIMPHNQSWFILNYSNATGWQILANGTSNAINPNFATNKLTIEENRIFKINDQTISSFSYELVGRVGLSGGSFADNVDIRYDNYLFAGKNCTFTSPTITTNNMSTYDTKTIERPSIENLMENKN